MDYKQIDEHSAVIRTLKENDIKIKPKGYSMYPLFVPGRDYAVITHIEPDKLKKGDVVLYRRHDNTGILVLHRICRIDKNRFYMVGDNQSEIEGPLEKECIHGKLIAVERNGRMFSVNNIVYRFISYVWLLLSPVRMPITKSAAAVKRCIKKMVKRNGKEQ